MAAEADRTGFGLEEDLEMDCWISKRGFLRGRSDEIERLDADEEDEDEEEKEKGEEGEEERGGSDPKGSAEFKAVLSFEGKEDDGEDPSFS